MGKIKSGIFGGVSGKVGNLTGSSWKGIPVIKSRPQSVAYPATTGQVSQTTKMSAIVAFCKIILSSWIKPLWDRAAVQMSGYNAFVRANIAEFADGEINSYSTLIMSQGTMASTPFVIDDLIVGDSNLVIAWDVSALSGLQLATDTAYVCVISETSGAVSVHSGEARNGGTSNIQLSSPIVAADILHVYLTFKRVNGTVISSNSYNTVAL